MQVEINLPYDQDGSMWPRKCFVCHCQISTFPLHDLSPDFKHEQHFKLPITNHLLVSTNLFFQTRAPVIYWKSILPFQNYLFISGWSCMVVDVCMLVVFITTSEISAYHHLRCELESHSGKVYLISTLWVGDWRQVGVLGYPPPIKVTAMI